MGIAELLAAVKLAREAGPEAVKLIRGILDGHEPTLEEIAEAEGRYDQLRRRRDQLIAEAEARKAAGQ